MPTFKFEPFNDARSGIRLLTIHPGSAHDPITCELKKHSLELLPHYEALSYTWGDSVVQHEIRINDQNFVTLGNAYDGLLELRHPTDVRVVWIDAICINQQDLEEKQHQILLIKTVYERASRVVVWLSRPRGDADLAVRLLDVLHLQIAEGTQTAQSMQDIHADRLRSPEWIALRDFLAHPWWTRIWTLQEVVVAQEIVFQFGTHIIPWDRILILGDSNSLLNGMFFRRPDEGVHKGYSQPPGCSAISTVEWMRGILEAGQGFSLLELLLQCWWRKATDTRDCIYGLSALSSDIGPDALNLHVDYAAAVEDVLTSAVVKILLRYGTLELFSKAGRGFPRSLGNLPSYVPDWSDMTIAAQPLFWHFYDGAQTLPPEEKGVSLHSSGRLQIQTFLLDTILEVSEPLSSVKDEYESQRLLSWFDEAEEMTVGGAKDPYPMTTPLRVSVSRFEAFWRTLVADRNLKRTSAPEGWFHGYLRYKDSLSQSCGKPTSSLFVDVEQYRGQYDSPVDVSAATMIDWFNMMIITSWGRSFCVTSNGMVGLVPPGAQAGDLVCLLVGGAVPFVMRPRIVSGPRNELELELVGESYFHGVTATDALEGFRSAGKEPRTAVLV